ncbi:hypothetical protein D4R99_01095 [bacterium]|nr:MAG: hypothetical protein D4R99_01095 [bacterium]
MKKKILSILILISGILISGGIISFANAQKESLPQPREQKIPGDMQFPIPELGNCTSKSNCKTFCDESKNSDACLSYAKQHKLMTSEEISNAKKFQDNGMVGPGGCKGQTECEQYCGISSHLEECTAFAEKNGMMSDQQLKDSKKVIAALKSGLKPPACTGLAKCQEYCSNPLHMEECMTFSLAAGIVPDNQKTQMQKTLDALKQGVKPPACQPNPPSDQLGQSGQTNQSGNGLPMCNEYCGTHQEECMTFSLATGMVPDDQKAQMQKTLDVLKQGIKPPACRPNPPDQSGQQGQPNQSGGAGGPNEGQGFNPGSGVNGNGPGLKNSSNQSNGTNQSEQGLQACDQYCADPNHVEECVKFSVAIGNMTEEQGKNSIKNGGKGPGECMGKDACNTFCNNPDNKETCFNFAKDNGMISSEDLQRIENGQPGQNQPGRKQPNQQIQPWADMCQPDENGNPTALACVDGSGNFVSSAKVGLDGKPVCPEDSTAKCGNYQQDNRQRQNQPGQNQPQNQQGQQGNKFQKGPGTIDQGGQRMPQQAGPGGCKGPEECKAYCESHQEECTNFQPQQNNQGQRNQAGQRQPQQQPGQPNHGITGVGPCGTGPGTCSGIGPDDINPRNGGNGTGGPNQGQGFNPGSGQGGNSQGLNQGGQPGQPGQRLPQQQPAQPNQGVTNVGPCGTGPGTCSGIGPDDINPKNENGGPNQGQGFNPGSGQNGNGTGIDQPNQPVQIQPQIPQQQNLPPPSQPISFLKKAQNLLANVLSALIR